MITKGLCAGHPHLWVVQTNILVPRRAHFYWGTQRESQGALSYGCAAAWALGLFVQRLAGMKMGYHPVRGHCTEEQEEMGLL